MSRAKPRFHRHHTERNNIMITAHTCGNPPPSEEATTTTSKRFRVVIEDTVFTEYDIDATSERQAEYIAISRYEKAGRLKHLEAHIRPEQWLPNQPICVQCDITDPSETIDEIISTSIEEIKQ